MSGFLNTHTLSFMSELWDRMDEAQKAKSKVVKHFFTLGKAVRSVKARKRKRLKEKIGLDLNKKIESEELQI